MFRYLQRKSQRRACDVAVGGRDFAYLELNYVERLESRAMLAGDVSASFSGGDLFVVGDRDGNNVELVAQDGGIVLVGLADTTVNGEEGPFSVAEGTTEFRGRVVVRLRGGDDRFVVQEGMTFTDTVQLFTGGGDDQVGLAASDFERVRVVTLGGDDSVAADSVTAKRLRIATRSGNDVISIVDTEVGESLAVVAGAGEDSVVVDGATVGKDLRVGLGRGDDTLVVQDSDVSGRFKARGFTGADVFSVDSNTVARRSAIRMGAGKDAVKISGNEFGQRSVARGGGGADQIENDASDSLRQVSFTDEDIDAELLDLRLNDATRGALALSIQAQAVFEFEGDETDDGGDTDGGDTGNGDTSGGDTDGGGTGNGDAGGGDTDSDDSDTDGDSSDGGDGMDPIDEPLTLNADFGLDAVNNVNGISVMVDDEFLVIGSTLPEAQVDVSTGRDGVFDDGTVTADATGFFEVTVPLENELDVTEVQIRASHNGEEVTDSAEVFYAVDTSVQFETSLGSITVELLPEAAPLTVRNFLNYLDRYDDSIVHRAPAGFVVQGGGFGVVDGAVTDISTDSPIATEFTPENSNLRGTLSMALLGGQPNSGTSGWFLNTADNEFLDGAQHTVFGRVDQAGLSVIDAIDDLPEFDVRDLLGETAFAETPLIDYSPFSEVLDGALEITASSPNVTGVGTAFLTDIPADNKISINGEVFDIASVDSDTSLTLSTAALSSAAAVTGNVNAIPGVGNFVFVDVVRL